MRRLLLIRHAPTGPGARGAFPADDPIGPAAARDAARLLARLPRPVEAISSPAVRCRQTADAAGLRPSIEPRIAECDFGVWAGSTLAELAGRDAEQWMNDLDAAPHGGESLVALHARVGAWLAEQANAAQTAVVVTHAGVIRSAVVHALGAPPEAMWRIEATHLSVTELRSWESRWTLYGLNGAP